MMKFKSRKIGIMFLFYKFIYTHMSVLLLCKSAHHRLTYQPQHVGVSNACLSDARSATRKRHAILRCESRKNAAQSAMACSTYTAGRREAQSDD